MMTTVCLHGVLAKKFGREWKFDIDYPAQAVNAIEAARPGFRLAILQMHKHVFRVKVGKRYIVEQYLRLPNNGLRVDITPILEVRASGKGIAQIIVGVALVAAGIVIGIGSEGTLSLVATQLILLGIGSVLGGVSALLAPSPAAEQTKKNKGSFLPQNQVNTMEQGGPVPLAYGNPMAGPPIISIDAEAVDITQGSANTTVNASENTGTSDAAAGQPAHPAGAALDDQVTQKAP